MGDHAQTLSGDHGGGTPEETDTVLFALSLKEPPGKIPAGLRSPPCSRQPVRRPSHPTPFSFSKVA
eukprot:jgi/Mesen1/3012/ME000177S02285